MKRSFMVNSLRVVVCDSREEMGCAAAADAAAYIRRILAENRDMSAIFAAAPSQNEVLAQLASEEGIDWSKVSAYHMDEYVGLAEDAPQRFAHYLDEHIFTKLPFGQVCYLIDGKGTMNPAYSQKFTHGHADICYMGIGENGHIAFNDPSVADFFDAFFAKEVTLDMTCRMQQVHDGCFASLEKVPERAITLTVPTLMRSSKLICVVPGATKSKAVYNALNGPISMTCPASILRIHPDATLYLDTQSASLLGDDYENSIL